MKLVAQPLTAADFEAAKAFFGPEKGDLSAAPFQAAWTVDPNDLDAVKAGVEWSLEQQKQLVENDPTVRSVKVVDEDNDNEIIATGRWHRYPHGYQHINDLEITGLKDRNDPHIWPQELNIPFYTGLLDTAFGERRAWMGEDHYWVLTNIVTRKPFRCLGAGSLILEWGLRQAAEEGVPSYLEANAKAKPLYGKHGFREIGMQKVDLTPYGSPGKEFTVARMRADPK